MYSIHIDQISYPFRFECINCINLYPDIHQGSLRVCGFASLLIKNTILRFLVLVGRLQPSHRQAGELLYELEDMLRLNTRLHFCSLEGEYRKEKKEDLC